MGWSRQQMLTYLQYALNMMPLKTAACNERFYDNVLQTLDNCNVLKKIDEYKGEIINNSAGYVSIAMYDNEARWTR
jgi:hypothetical protein